MQVSANAGVWREGRVRSKVKGEQRVGCHVTVLVPEEVRTF